MKKVFSILAVVMLFTACEQNIQTNTPAFQAKLDGTLWRAKDAKVTIDGAGGMTITAFTSAQTVIMKTRAAAVGTYVLGTTDYASNHASYDIATAALEDFYDTSVVVGPAYKLSALTSGGTGYVESPAGAQTTGGSGSGLRVATEVTSGAVTKITMVSRGLGYKAGDIITIVGGGNNAKFKVVNVQSSNGEVVITDTAGGLYSGTFKFNAVNEEGEVVTFSEGYFFKIPLGL
ncbi:DUF6252 family protein [Flavobacterium ardleyense]|uniref:DUF6252 family protein n=1 Tax=Flavobacterium ardleyense TaxID=2038737 RepID=A0ABW5Z985_9FLAO